MKLNTLSTEFSTAKVFRGPASGWRVRAKLAVRGNITEPLIGLFEPGTHHVMPLLDSPDHHPAINPALRIIKAAITLSKTAPYNEKMGGGVLRYLQLVVDRATGKIQLTLVATAPVTNLVELLKKENLWHSIWVNYQPERTNTIFGNRWELVWGDSVLWEKICGVDIAFHPACFGQANLSLFEQLLISAKKMIPEKRKLVEFYAGVGAIGLVLAQQSASVALCELHHLAEECFSLSRDRLPEQEKQKLSFHTGRVETHTALLEEVVIVDPPRKGIDESLLSAIIASDKVKHLLYISCSALSFQRDVEKLKEHGWKVEQLEIYDLFPGTDHFEILALLSK